MTIKETRSIFVTFSDDELAEKKSEHYAVLREVEGIKVKHKTELAPFKRRVKSLVECIEEGGEKRSIECEWRDGLVNGVRECVRLDTMQVIDTISDEEPEEERAQPGLPFAAPAVPELRCSAVDEDGEAHPITAEQADTLERTLAAFGPPQSFVLDNGRRIDRIVKVLRHRACEFCGAADGNHRPECKSMREEAALEDWRVGDAAWLKSGSPDLTVEALGDDGIECSWQRIAGDRVRDVFAPATLTRVRTPLEVADDVDPDQFAADDIEPDPGTSDDYDRDDPKQVAAKIREGAKPNDRPLPSAADATVRVKPKRAKKGEAANANGGE